jgi:hypothetical protein
MGSLAAGTAPARTCQRCIVGTRPARSPDQGPALVKAQQKGNVGLLLVYTMRDVDDLDYWRSHRPDRVILPDEGDDD